MGVERSEVADRGAHQQRVGARAVPGHRRGQAAGVGDLDELQPGRHARPQVRPDQGHRRPPVARRLGQGGALGPGRGVAQKAHRVDGLARGPGRDHDAPAAQAPVGPQRAAQMIDQLRRRGQPARSAAARGMTPAGRLQHQHPALGQAGQGVPDRRAGQHVLLHRRSQQYRSAYRQQGRGEDVRGPPAAIWARLSAVTGATSAASAASPSSTCAIAPSSDIAPMSP